MSPQLAVADPDALLEELHIAVIIPAYEAEATIRDVLESVPGYVRTIVVVSDDSRDATASVVEDVARGDARVVLEVHHINRGVGAAMRTGYRRALAAGADILVKMDSDGQMDPAYLPHLILPIALGQADYTKGNRFLRPQALRRMPRARLLGNAVLSFVTKLSSGYWHLLDPTNGYTAISREALMALDLEVVDDRFFFESSMLIELGMVRAVVVDVPIPSRYGSEQSHLSLTASVLSFALKHVRFGLRRLVYRYLLLDFSAVSLLLAVSLPLTAFGVTFGLRNWIRSSLHGTPATAGTVMLAAFTSAGGLFGIVQAMIYDIMSTPTRPLTLPRVRVVGSQPAAAIRPDRVARRG